MAVCIIKKLILGNNSNKSIQMSSLIEGENIFMFGNNNSYGDASIPLETMGITKNNKNNKILNNDYINSQIELEKFISNKTKSCR